MRETLRNPSATEEEGKLNLERGVEAGSEREYGYLLYEEGGFRVGRTSW